MGDIDRQKAEGDVERGGTQSRGERYDEQSGGGRSADTVSFDRERDGTDEIAEDQRAHQDRGQSEAEDEVE
ncbi:MAG: hypothetical protein QOI38_1015 [Sphingomonadales bacterium]|jgi:hypothetical protein|nr:hypothetical protein [Sphingomonadales bacterium]